MAVGTMEVKTFTHPGKGFEFISSGFSEYTGESSIIFLDLNMPVMTGWEFLEHFEELDETIKKKVGIYILTTSQDPRDRKRATANKNVLDYIIKPITKKTILDILT